MTADASQFPRARGVILWSQKGLVMAEQKVDIKRIWLWPDRKCMWAPKVYGYGRAEGVWLW